MINVASPSFICFLIFFRFIWLSLEEIFFFWGVKISATSHHRCYHFSINSRPELPSHTDVFTVHWSKDFWPIWDFVQSFFSPAQHCRHRPRVGQGTAQNRKLSQFWRCITQQRRYRINYGQYFLIMVEKLVIIEQFQTLMGPNRISWPPFYVIIARKKRHRCWWI